MTNTHKIVESIAHFNNEVSRLNNIKNPRDFIVKHQALCNMVKNIELIVKEIQYENWEIVKFSDEKIILSDVMATLSSNGVYSINPNVKIYPQENESELKISFSFDKIQEDFVIVFDSTGITNVEGLSSFKPFGKYHTVYIALATTYDLFISHLMEYNEMLKMLHLNFKRITEDIEALVSQLDLNGLESYSDRLNQCKLDILEDEYPVGSEVNLEFNGSISPFKVLINQKEMLIYAHDVKCGSKRLLEKEHFIRAIVGDFLKN